MINRTKTLQVLRNQLRQMFLELECTQEQKLRTMEPGVYVVLDNQIGELRTNINIIKDLIKFLDTQESSNKEDTQPSV